MRYDGYLPPSKISNLESYIIFIINLILAGDWVFVNINRTSFLHLAPVRLFLILCYLNQDFSLPWAIKLAKVKTLPGTQDQSAAINEDGQGNTNQ